jgi:hypothetical protein
MKSRIIAFLLVVMVSISAWATTSTIDPTVPATNAALSSSVIRNNFLAAYNDINTIFNNYLTQNQTITLSGDCTGSGRTAITAACARTGGNLFAASATVNALNANNINSGTLLPARLPVATATSQGAVTTSTGLLNTSGSISVLYGTTATSATVGNDSRFSATVPVSRGGTGFIDAGMNTAASDNQAALQAAITSQVDKMLLNSTWIGTNAINLGSGQFNFVCTTTPCIASRPAVKLLSNGPTWLNFTNMDASYTALSVYNDDAPAGSFSNRYNSENYGPFLNGDFGGILMTGPGIATASIGISVGDNGTATSDANFRDTSMRGIVVRDFGKCLNIRPNNFYMTNYDGMTLGRCTYGIYSSGTNTNSGERLVFSNMTIGASTSMAAGLYAGANNLDYFFENTSIDFVTDAIQIPASIAGTIFYHGGWLENVEDAIVDSSLTLSGGQYFTVTIDGTKIIPTSLTSANNRPNRPLFKGYFNLNLNNVVLGGWANTSLSASNGLFMVDNKVNIKQFNPYVIMGNKQLIAQQTLLNNDPFFAQGVDGDNQTDNPMTSWRQRTASGITATVDDDGPVYTTYGGTKSLVFTGVSSPTTNYNVQLSNTFPVTPGKTLLGQAVFYGNLLTSASTKIEYRFLFSSSNGNLPTVYDAAASGDNFLADYNDSSDPAYQGGATTWWAKSKAVRQAVVPAGYDQAQFEFTISVLPIGESVSIGFAGVNQI